jgi:hypothetical protein
MALDNIIRDRENSNDPNFYDDPDMVNADHYLMAADIARWAGPVGADLFNAEYAARKLRGGVQSSGNHPPSPASADADRWSFRGTFDRVCGQVIGD